MTSAVCVLTRAALRTTTVRQPQVRVIVLVTSPYAASQSAVRQAKHRCGGSELPVVYCCAFNVKLSCSHCESIPFTDLFLDVTNGLRIDAAHFVSYQTMFSDLAKSSLEFLKLAPRYLLAVAIVAGTLLFSPVEWLEKIGLQAIAMEYRQWLGLSFLVSATLWAVGIALSAWNALTRKFFRRSVRQHVMRRLASLTEDEKQILRYYLAKNTRANMLKVDDGVVQGLVADRIIYRSASMGHLLEGFAHNITDFAWDYLHANPELLNGSTNFYRTDKRERGW